MSQKKDNKINKKQNPENSSLLGKLKHKKEKHKYRVGFYYSFLTLVLLICLVQIIISAVLNITKTISYKSKIATISKSLEEAQLKNRQLKEEINTLSKNKNLELEAIARNTLKMSYPDEVLVIINPKPQQIVNDNPKFKIYKKSEKK